MARPSSKGAYTPLAAQYYLDDAILEAGPDAELLFVRILSFLASVSTDGFITERQLKIVGIGLRAVPKRVASLQDVGLLVAEPGGFTARSWLKWNKSAEQIGRARAKDRDRKAQKSGEEGLNSERNPGGSGPHSSPQYSTVQSSSVQSKDLTSEAAIAPVRPDVEMLCNLLVDLVVANGDKRPSISKVWRDEARRLIDIDGRAPEDAARLMRWALDDSFWKGNIRSMPKFREKFDQLRHNANQALTQRTQTRPSPREENLAFVASLEAEQRAGLHPPELEV